MFTQRAAPGARNSLNHMQNIGGHLKVKMKMCILLVCVCVHVLVDFLHYFYDFGSFSMSNLLTGQPKAQVLRWSETERGLVTDGAE